MPPKAVRPPNRGRRAIPVTVGAPTGGLNGRDSLTDMSPKDAFLLDNWFPNLTSVDTRGGSNTHGTGYGHPVESLETYTGASGAKMLAFCDGKIYDATSAGAVGAALTSGRVSNKVTSCMFSNAGSQFLLVYSGADAPLSYAGAGSPTALTITGLTGSQNLVFQGHPFKGRVFLAQTGMLGFYYLGIGAIQGAASYFDLSQQSVKGGSLACITSVSQSDSGAGPQDYALFVTTEGEYIMYTGTDPSTAATWSLVGRYYGPPPIGKKGWFKFRSDVYFITEEGVLSFTQIRQLGETKDDQQYITSKLGKNYTDPTVNLATHGWCGFIYPRGGALIVNVPLTASVTGPYAQFAMNTTSNAWGRYLKWDALTWTVLDRRAYYGTNDGRVILADDGYTDNGVQVQAVARQAWNTFDDGQGLGDSDKQYHFATLAMSSDGAPAIAVSLNTNYEDEKPTYVTSIVGIGGAEWDIATWDVDAWAGGASTQTLNIPVGKIGYISSLWMQAASSVSKVQWFATRYLFEKTKGVLI